MSHCYHAGLGLQQLPIGQLSSGFSFSLLSKFTFSPHKNRCSYTKTGLCCGVYSHLIEVDYNLNNAVLCCVVFHWTVSTECVCECTLICTCWNKWSLTLSKWCLKGIQGLYTCFVHTCIHVHHLTLEDTVNGKNAETAVSFKCYTIFNNLFCISCRLMALIWRTISNTIASCFWVCVWVLPPSQYNLATVQNRNVQLQIWHIYNIQWPKRNNYLFSFMNPVIMMAMESAEIGLYSWSCFSQYHSINKNMGFHSCMNF